MTKKFLSDIEYNTVLMEMVLPLEKLEASVINCNSNLLYLSMTLPKMVF